MAIKCGLAWKWKDAKLHLGATKEIQIAALKLVRDTLPAKAPSTPGVFPGGGGGGVLHTKLCL